ncbi:hypothetical protein GGI07_005425 [Coemansia sp. Benny D115]|nr:hypothetical protein GGI07_005425 [Coemansia sp. Benny D115]
MYPHSSSSSSLLRTPPSPSPVQAPPHPYDACNAPAVDTFDTMRHSGRSFLKRNPNIQLARVADQASDIKDAALALVGGRYAAPRSALYAPHSPYGHGHGRAPLHAPVHHAPVHLPPPGLAMAHPPPPPLSLSLPLSLPLPAGGRSSASLASPTLPTSPTASRKRSRHAWPPDMTRQIINVLLDEFLVDPSFRTTIYRSREERDHRFIHSGRSILEEYNKVQNIRRRYFIPLSYLLQWEQLRHFAAGRSRQRANIEKKLAKPLERSRLQMIFCSPARSPGAAPADDDDSDSEDSAELGPGAKPMFELDIFVAELKQRDPKLWARGLDAYNAWVSRKCSIDFILNH